MALKLYNQDVLTKDDLDYLARIPDGKRAVIKPFDPKAKKLGEEVIKKIRRTLPYLEVKFMGSMMLGISGQQDIDIYVISKARDFARHIPALTKLFGKPNHIYKDYISWDVEKDGHLIDLYLMDPQRPSMIKQLKIYETLKKNKKLLAEYEKMKEKMKGKPLRKYQQRKLEFFNNVVGPQINKFDSNS